MTFRALSLVFRPAAVVLGRLRYAQKFVVVGLVLLVPLGFVAGAYVQSQRAQIAFSAKERQGVAYLLPLIQLTGRAVQARHQAVAGTVPDGPGLDRDIAAVNAVDRRLGAVLDTKNAWSSTRGQLATARRTTGRPVERYRAYNAAVDRLLALIVHVGDESNLTLDPDLDTYYLMDTLQFRLPVLLDTAGRAVDRALVAADGPADGPATTAPDGVIDIGLAAGVLTSTRTAIARAVTTIGADTTDADVRADTGNAFRRLSAATTALERTLTTAVRTRQLDTVPATASDPVRAAAADFAVHDARSLDRLLRARIDRFAGRAHQVEWAAGLAALLGGYLFMGFYLSVAPSIRRIVATLHAVAGGDLTRRVSVDTQDELSFVARALNETVATTEIATNRLARQATHDTLTGLPNRALVLDRLGRALDRAACGGDPVAVLFIDLDRFKPINDSLGHEAGDEVLRRVAARLTALVGPDDTVARLAGDEFVVIAESLRRPAEAVRTGERIVAELSRPIMTGVGIAAREISVGASVGLAFIGGIAAGGSAHRAGPTPDDLLRDADVAMYRAKQRGRGRVEVFDDALRVAVQHRLETHDDLRRAIDSGQIQVYYQPIVDGPTATTLGLEALARWRHPVRGLLGPAEFIGIAEESGLIVPLGAEILAQACTQAARWRADGADLHVAVNVSGAQFSHSSFVASVAAVLDRTGLDPDALWLEITETSIMADAEAAAETLRAIRALGVHLAIDDFGTGYSSLTYLRRFPVEALKIDRSFVAGIGRDREDDAIVGMILGLARTLDLHVVAEGVERVDQLAELRRLGCGLMQGFLFGRPAPPEDLEIGPLLSVQSENLVSTAGKRYPTRRGGQKRPMNP